MRVGTRRILLACSLLVAVTGVQAGSDAALVRLPAPIGPMDTLLIRNAQQSYEAYVDGVSIGGAVFRGRAWQIIPLTSAMSGGTLSLRLPGAEPEQGVAGTIAIGAKETHYLTMLRSDLANLIVGFVFLCVGVITLTMFLGIKGERLNDAFGGMLLIAGVHSIAETDIKQLFLDAPTAWAWIELISLFLIPAAFGFFLDQLFSGGRWLVFRWSWQVALVCIAVSVIYAVARGSAPWGAVTAFGWFLALFGVVCGASLVAFEIWQKTEARVVCSGLISWVLAVGYGVNHVGQYDGRDPLIVAGNVTIAVSLAWIVARRYVFTVGIKKNLELASTVQTLLLPKVRQGDFARFDFASFYHPYGQMSGDWLNFWRVSEFEQRLFFGDVVGKGPQAALAVAAIAAFFADAKIAGDSTEEAIQRINRGLKSLFNRQVNTTLTAVCLRDSEQVELYNCGGQGWMHLGEKAKIVVMPSLMLGLDDDFKIGFKQLTLQPGETLIGFTDGVVDGIKGMKKLGQAFDRAQVRELRLNALFDIAVKVGQTTALDDDQSILAVKAKISVSKSVSQPANPVAQSS